MNYIDFWDIKLTLHFWNELAVIFYFFDTWLMYHLDLEFLLCDSFNFRFDLAYIKLRSALNAYHFHIIVKKFLNKIILSWGCTM